MHPDPETLRALRDAIAALEEHEGPGLPRVALAKLADAAPPGFGVTLDLAAAAELGRPLVVLRPTPASSPGSASAASPPEPEAPPSVFATLTPREREVAGFVATGLRNKDIALALGISLGTVKDHVHRILRKSGLDSRTAVAAEWTG